MPGVNGDYAAFLKAKSQAGPTDGFEPLWIPDFLFDFQRSLVEWAVRKGRAAVFAACGLGKALCHNEPVLTPTGWKPIGSLATGDEVIGSDGNPHRVLGVYPQGIRELFAVRFTDGVKVVCDADHLWSVKTQQQRYKGRNGETLSTRQIMETGLADGLNRKRHFVPLVRPVQSTEKDLPIDPYTLGVLLGDGSFRGLSPSLTTADPEILTHLVLPAGVEARLKRGGRRAPSYMLSVGKAGCGRGKTNPLTDKIKFLGLMNHLSYDKFIPETYLRGSVDQRRAILAGLLDTDGSVCDGTIEFVSTSRRLAEGVAELVQSLGGTAPIRDKQPYYIYRGELKPGRTAYRVNVKLPGTENPFRLTRKRDAWKPRGRAEPPRAVAAIEPAGNDHAVCIRVDSPDNLFVTRGHVLTHNTPMQLVWAENVVRKTNRPVLILTPLAVAGQTVREAEKFGVEAVRSRDGRFPAGARIVVTNYDQIDKFRPEDFAGAACDESGGIKHFDARRTADVTEFLRTLPYRLLCTATPAPNDYDELGTSAEALGEMGYQDMLTRFFRKQLGASPLGWNRMKYSLKGHAERDFWRWVCSWSRACRRPSDLGYDDAQFTLPPLETHEHVVRARVARAGYLFDLPAITLPEQREERRRSLAERCERVAELVAATGAPAVAWCHLNDEGDALTRIIPGAVQVTGSEPDESKEEKFLEFQAGGFRVLVTKPVIAAWGLNWQHCAHQTFFPSHSFEQFFQAVRRCWRFGQVRPVRIDVVSSEGEAGVLANLNRKADAAERMFDQLVSLMNDSLEIGRDRTFPNRAKVPAWLVSGPDKE